MIDFASITIEVPEVPENVAEYFAAEFLKETGLVAPGKDQAEIVVNPPDFDRNAQRYAEWMHAENGKRAKQARLYYAIVLTRESMAMCEVPFHIRDQQIELLVKQMKKASEFENYATCQVERYWHYREIHDFCWNYKDKEADYPCSYFDMRAPE